MSFAQDIAKAEYTEKGVHLEIGEYQAKFTKALFKRSQKSGDVFIAEFTLTASSSERHFVGSSCSWVQKMQNMSIAGGAIKGFFYALCGAVKPEERAKVDAVLTTLITKIESGQSTGLEGRTLAVSVVPHQTRDGRNITIMRFAPVI